MTQSLTVEGAHDCCKHWFVQLAAGNFSLAEGSCVFRPHGFLLLRQAVGAMDKAEDWTNPSTMGMLHNIYWPCTGAAVHFSTAVKQDPSFGFGRMPSYASAADLEREKRHVMYWLSYI